MDTYTYQKLRGRLRGASAVDPAVRDVCTWRTDRHARERIAANPQACAKAASRVLVEVATEDEIVDVLGPCFLASLGAMRLRMCVHEVFAERPMDTVSALRGAVMALMTLANSMGASAEQLAPYKKILDGAK